MDLALSCEVNRQGQRNRAISFTVCIAITGNLQKYELTDNFSIKSKILDIIFMQTGHFLSSFKNSTLYFNIIR